jgi:hypothetical protein
MGLGYNMKRQYSYLVALMLIIDSQVAIGESPRTRKDELRVSSESSEDLREKKLRNLLKSADPARVSYLLAASKEVTISQGKAGQLRVFVGNVSTELLTTKINLVSFGSTERYNAIYAITAITHTKEIQAKLGELGLRQPATFGPSFILSPDRRLPHLPTSIRNVTMEEALDQVAETFDCVIIYAGWTEDGKRRFDVDCAEGEDFQGLGRKRKGR